MAASPQSPAPLEKVELIAAAARGVPGVADLNGGQFGEHTTYLPGRRLAGVTETNGRVTVAVTARAGYPLLALADQIRTAVSPLSSIPPEVVIADLDA